MSARQATVDAAATDLRTVSLLLFLVAGGSGPESGLPLIKGSQNRDEGTNSFLARRVVEFRQQSLKRLILLHKPTSSWPDGARWEGRSYRRRRLPSTRAIGLHSRPWYGSCFSR